MHSFPHTTKTVAGFLAKPATAFLFALLLITFAAGQKPASKATADSILGVKVGMTARQADEALEKVGNHSEGESGEAEEGETKEAWTMRGTAFSQVVVMKDKSNRIVWVSGFVRQ